MRNIKEIHVEEPLEEHPLTDTFQMMFNELAEYCGEVLEIQKKMKTLDRSNLEFYKMMARLDTILMAMGLTTKHLRHEAERMDEMFEE